MSGLSLPWLGRKRDILVVGQVGVAALRLDDERAGGRGPGTPLGFDLGDGRLARRAPRESQTGETPVPPF